MCFIRYGTPPTAHPAQLHTGLFRINPHSCEASHAGNKPNASKPSTTPVEVIKDDTLSCMLPSGHKPRTKRATNAHSLSSRPAPPWRRVTPVQRHGCHAAMRTALQHMKPFENSSTTHCARNTLHYTISLYLSWRTTAGVQQYAVHRDGVASRARAARGNSKKGSPDLDPRFTI